ncbi:hypothetical protein JYT19_00230, partial [Sulfobacillus acidophilus]|nr:hypothetical protein [Sulfobacillus acidophilus]
MATKIAIPKELSKQKLIEAYKLMYTSRLLDKKMMKLLRLGKSFFHIGCMGHEAVQVAMGFNLVKKRDFLLPYYRDQAVCLSMGQSAKDCLLSFLAKADDPNSGGRQMPQHYGHKEHNILTSSSSTGTQFLHSLGCAFASVRDFAIKANSNTKKDYEVTVVCCGDGTTSQGDFHEALNWATREKAPVIFLVENNGYAISVPLKDQRPEGKVSTMAKGYGGLNLFEFDGCNFLQSYTELKKAVKLARDGKGPSLVDANVVRLMPHSSSDDDKKYRSKQELAKDLKRDPVILMSKFLLANKIVTKKALETIEKAVFDSVEAAADEALAAPMPKKESATTHVFSSKSEPKLIEPKINSQGQDIVLVDAINRALQEEMANNEKVLVFGEDVAGNKGGVFTATRGLTAKFGDNRCYNSPLAESSIVGV